MMTDIKPERTNKHAVLELGTISAIHAAHMSGCSLALKAGAASKFRIVI